MGKALSKTQKKIDDKIRVALNTLCEEKLKDFSGFLWLSHQANYTNFPASLLVICVFDNEENATNNTCADQIRSLIQAKLLKTGVRFKSLAKQVIFDSEEHCNTQDKGSWKIRMQRYEGRAVPRNRP